jgi:hypothetical protein
MYSYQSSINLTLGHSVVSGKVNVGLLSRTGHEMCLVMFEVFFSYAPELAEKIIECFVEAG